MHTYRELLQRVADRQANVVPVLLDDLYEYNQDEDFVTRVTQNGARYRDLFSTAIDMAMPQASEDAVELRDDPLEVRNQQRIKDRAQRAESGNAVGTAEEFPPSLLRTYEVRLIPRAVDKAVIIRDVRAAAIGSLTTVKGIVTRVTDVKPMLTVAAYTCDTCGSELYQEVTSSTYKPLAECPTETCNRNRVRGELHAVVRGSRFVKFQEVKLQEMADQVPVGHIPRQMTVHVRGELTRSCTAGDLVNVSGIFLPVPVQGFKAIRQGLIADTYLDAQSVVCVKEQSSQDLEEYDEETREALEEIEAGDETLYDRLAHSIAPEIWGHVDVKKSLLLMMVGGQTRNLSDGMRIRGDINVLLMGDPGVAKSQLLKFVAHTSPRAVYTTGKGSSGVGLTAAVLKDPLTNEFVLEGGALVLADMGICCIDEFDKMMEADQTAIHEVMEQQTVSIAKAGITTTLNARTSVLAAANPVAGRYNPTKSASYNINLPTALLSRFDLVYVLRDLANDENDRQLAAHVTHVHLHSAPPPRPEGDEVFEPKVLRAYVNQAKRLEPFIPESGPVVDMVVDQYVAMRNERDPKSDDDTFTTARTLLAILRLAQAVARLRLSPMVEARDVEEATRLMKESKSQVAKVAGPAGGMQAEPVSKVYHIIMALVRARIQELEDDADEDEDADGPVTVRYTDALERVVADGMNEQDLENCLVTYTNINILQFDRAADAIRLIQPTTQAALRQSVREDTGTGALTAY